MTQNLPTAARCYLQHAIAPTARLASAVRLRMHGTIKLQRWLPFTAEQVIRSDGEMLWQATVSRFGLPIRGYDRVVRGEGAMQWKLLGLFTVMASAGPDITRSAIGRVQAESLAWLPSALYSSDVSWTGVDMAHAHVRRSTRGEVSELDLTVYDDGRLKAVTLPRWADPDGRGFRYVDFGALAEEEATFDGYTIATRLRVGYYPGTARFESEGEFFRVTIDHASYR